MKRILKLTIGAIVLLILLFFIIRTLAFKVFIYPNWLKGSLDDISEVHLSSEHLDLEITDQETVKKLYGLCKNTKIKNLEFDTSELNSYMYGFNIVFHYNDDTSDCIECSTKDAAVLKQPSNAFFGLRGEKNEELLSLLLEIEKNENSDIILDQEQIFTEAEEYLKEYEKDFNKIIHLAKADKSTQKEKGGGCISLTDNYLTFHNSELEEQCLSLMNKKNILYISFSKSGVTFTYKSNSEYIASVVYNYNDNAKERKTLDMFIKKIKPFYYMECITLSNQ